MPKDKIEQYIMEIIEKYTPILLLQRHIFEIEKAPASQKAFMECLSNYPCLDATIRYSEECITEWKKGKDIVPYILHEMCHLLTEPLYTKAVYRYVTKDEISDERENLTELICNIIIKNKL